MRDKSITVKEKDEFVKINRRKNNRINLQLENMRLHKKMIIIFTVITIAMLSIVYFITKDAFLNNVNNIEDKYTRKQVKQVANALSQDIFQLKSFNQDYAGWNATYVFVKDRNSNYIEENLIDETFSTNGWNVFVLIDKEGKVVYEKGYDLENEKEVPMSKSLLKHLNIQLPLLRSSKIGNCASGIISLPEGHMMLSSHPVVTSGFKGPIRGWLVIGRIIDSNKISELSKQTGLEIVMGKFTKDDIPQNSQIEHVSFDNKARIWTKNKDDKHISGYLLINDIYQKPAFILSFHSSRYIYGQVGSSINYLMIIIIIIGVIYLITAWFFMNKFIFDRLRILVSSVSEISKNKDLSTRVSVLFKDEISLLESEFNNMLDALEDSQERIIYQSHYDELTNLPNRNYFYRQTKQLLIQGKHCNRTAAILFIDIDKFKNINDSLGHEIGDKVLKIVGDRLKDILPNDSIVSRIGGDEFIVLLSNIQAGKTEEVVARRIIRAIKQPFCINDKQILITASVGISLYPDDGTDVETLINNADVAMHGVKKERNSSFRLYTADMRNRLSADMLRRALEKNELQLHYQPQVNGLNGIIEGMEALLRWENPEFGMISPLEFIPLAEETGLIIPIGKWVLWTACMQNKKWQEKGYPSLRVAVNISSIQFMQPDFIHIVKRILRETGLDGKYLELEITESVALNNEEDVIDRLLMLRDMGIRISIDDFGTGYSSLSYLERLPIDSLKIDRTFITNIVKNSTISKMIIGMAQSLALSVVAEGVETKEQLDYLIKYGCIYMQGYLFSKPLPVEMFEKLLAEQENLLPKNKMKGCMQMF